MNSLVCGVVCVFVFAQACAGYTLVVPDASPENLIEGKYVVSFYNNVSVSQRRVALDSLQKLIPGEIKVFNIGSFTAFSASLTQRELLILEKFAVIEYVEQQQLFHTAQCAAEESCTVQNSATWGISRVSNADFTDGNADTYSYGPDGSGSYIYVVDTGIRTTHVEFEDRAVWGGDFSGENSFVDGNGHGTHVAGTVAGKTYGLAKEAGLVAVKVLGASGSGSTAGVIEGVDFSVSDCDGKHQTNKCVINMSLSGSGSRVMDGAVEGAVEAGVYVVVAAGNSNDDSCNYSPARSDAVMTVMASVEPPAGQSDKRATYSNYGPCVDITAPGSSITSAWSTSDTAINTISGTSMASPHVAGAACLLRSQGNFSPAQTTAALACNYQSLDSLVSNCVLARAPVVCEGTVTSFLQTTCQ